MMTLIYSANAALFTLVRVLMEKDATIYHDTLTNTVCVLTAGFCVHLVTFHRAFTVEADDMRQAFTAAAAAPHGGHVMVKEWIIICSHIEKKHNQQSLHSSFVFFGSCSLVSFLQQTQKFSQTSPPPAASETAV